MKKTAIILLTALAVFSSCGKNGTAEDTVKAFLSENLKGGAPQNFIIERLDSTNFLVDSAIVVMHKNTEASPNYKQGINYAKRPAKQRLVWITATFETQGKAQKQTFYLNRECDQVIAVNP